jgi:transposase
MVEADNYSIMQASDHLNINYSTAKSILRMFRFTGRIETKKKKSYPWKIEKASPLDETTEGRLHLTFNGKHATHKCDQCKLSNNLLNIP